MYYQEDEEVINVELYAKQFSWEARYSGNDNTLGYANVRYVKGANTVGVDLSDKASLDDIVTKELHLPVGKKIVFKFRSQDVLHSAYMPHFRAQMNCVPGDITQFVFTPTITTKQMREDRDIINKVKHINELRTKRSKERQLEGKSPLELYEFDYLLLCNKICGASHYNMQMKIVVESEEEYKKWLEAQPTLNSIVNKGKEDQKKKGGAPSLESIQNSQEDVVTTSLEGKLSEPEKKLLITAVSQK